MSDFIYEIVSMRDIVSDLNRFTRDEVVHAEQAFVAAMQAHLSNYADYTDEDIQACLEDCYEAFGQGNSIQLFWADD